MGKARIEVYTSPTCPHCPSAVSLAKEISEQREDVRLRIYSLAEKNGMSRAERYGIMSTPTILVTGECSDGFIGFRGTPARETLIKAIEKALCQRDKIYEQKKGFLSLIKKLLS